MTTTRNEVIKYYDEYTSHQIEMGINARHRRIHSWLLQFGLQSNHSVLEIGCGVGTQTALLADYLRDDVKITANDISPKSVEIAKKRLVKHKNINWSDQDFVQWQHSDQYDVILLPDVIEHIPVELHNELFRKIATNLKDDGFVLIHIPNPMYLEWCEKYTPEKLQVIDQAIHTEEIIRNTWPHGLYIHFLSTYSIWVDNGDYTVIVLKKKVEVEKRDFNMIVRKQSFWKRVLNKIKRTLQ